MEFWLKKFPTMSSKEENNILEHMKSVIRESWKVESGKRKVENGKMKVES